MAEHSLKLMGCLAFLCVVWYYMAALSGGWHIAQQRVHWASA
jgi:hypothetical protein